MRKKNNFFTHTPVKLFGIRFLFSVLSIQNIIEKSKKKRKHLNEFIRILNKSYNRIISCILNDNILAAIYAICLKTKYYY